MGFPRTGLGTKPPVYFLVLKGRHVAGIRAEGPGDAAPQLAALWRGLGLCLWGQADQESHDPQYDHSEKKNLSTAQAK